MPEQNFKTGAGETPTDGDVYTLDPNQTADVPFGGSQTVECTAGGGTFRISADDVEIAAFPGKRVQIGVSDCRLIAGENGMTAVVTKDVEEATLQHEVDRGAVLLTPSQAEHIMMTGVELDSVDATKAEPTKQEIAEGVTDVECAGVSIYPLANRPEQRSLLSDDFKGAVLRLQRRPNGDTTRLTVTTYHGDPKQEGKHSSEYNCEVYVFDTEGRVIEGHYEVSKIYRSFADHPQGNSASEVITGDAIPEDELAAKAATRVKDVNVCVDAGV